MLLKKWLGINLVNSLQLEENQYTKVVKKNASRYTSDILQRAKTNLLRLTSPLVMSEASIKSIRSGGS